MNPWSLFQKLSLCSLVVWLCWLFTAAAITADEPPRPYGIEKHVPWTTSRLIGRPDPPPPYTVKRAFPKLTFKNPVYIAQEPGSDRFVVAELAGKIYAFSRSEAESGSRKLFLDAGREVYSFSFHPRYESNGHVFVFSPRDPKSKEKDPQSRVSRFTAHKEGTGVGERSCAADTEEIIVEWPSGGHNGGEAIIGPDGMLYVSTGDSTSTSDEKSTGQGVDDLLSVIMRIDVDHPTIGKRSKSDKSSNPEKLYSIPPDNPFVDYPGARPEIWAFGFRNPWRMSFDARTGALWVGDVGQDLWEMIWRVQRGGNYGWSVQEGTHSFHPHKKQGPGPILPPVVEHHHTECRSITGGYVYYGNKFPELQGAYFYGDYEYGKVWAVRHDGQKTTWQNELADTSLRIASFGVSRQGEIYLIDHPSGEIYQLERAPKSEANAQFPTRLSETGLFDSTAKHQMAPGVIPFSVNAPQWLDHAFKERYVAFPPEAQITFVERGGNANTWNFDDGCVAAETIFIDTRQGDPTSRRRLETRVLVKQENHWLGYSYLWNEQQTDAELVEALGKELTLSFEDPAAPGGQRRQSWRVPSRNECMVCHSRAAGFVLGLRTSQMNRSHYYPRRTDHQLEVLEHLGLFDKPLPNAPHQYDALANPYDEAADLTARARAYLQVNCSVCHVGSGGGNAKMELWYYTDLEKTGLINETPLHGAFGLTDGKIINTGDPFASVLLYRLSKVGRGRMPHVGARTIDAQALDLMHDWILSLGGNDTGSSGGNSADASAAKLVHTQTIAMEKELQTIAQVPERKRAEAIGRLLADTRSAFVVSRIAGRPSYDPRLPSRQEIISLGASHPDPNVRDLFERFLPESQRTRRLGEQFDPQEVLSRKGDLARGRQFFLLAAAAQCKNCHKIDGEGGDLGPDLSGIGAKYKRPQLLESLVDPSKQVDPKFAAHVLVTTKGKVHTGIVMERTDQHITLNTFENGLAKRIRIAAEEIDEISPQQQSLMPDRLLRDLTAQQAADLLDFLASLKKKDPSP